MVKRAQAPRLEAAPPSRLRKRRHAGRDLLPPPTKKPKLSPSIKIEAEIALQAAHFDTLDPVSVAFNDFPQGTPILRDIYKELRSLPWHSISDIPLSIQKLGVNYPRLIPSSRCWLSGESPPIGEVLAHCVDNFQPGDVTIEAHPTTSKDERSLGNVIRQVLQPSAAEHPMVAHNLPIDGIGMLDPNAIPKDPFDLSSPDIDYSMNITPANTIVDVHIDQGTNGLSIGLGREQDPDFLKVHKLWFLWPPTQHNLGEYERLRSSNSTKTTRVLETSLRLARSSCFEYGVIASIGPEAGIFLPAGWIHATVTIRGGFLGGITFNSAATIGMASSLMAIDCRLFPSSFGALAPLYASALETLVHPGKTASQRLSPGDYAKAMKSIADSMSGWLEIESSLRRINFRPLTRDRSICCQILDSWRRITSFLDRHNGMTFPRKFPLTAADCVSKRKFCSCGWKGKGKGLGYLEHFWRKHLKIITPDKCKTPFDD